MPRRCKISYYDGKALLPDRFAVLSAQSQARAEYVLDSNKKQRCEEGFAVQRKKVVVDTCGMWNGVEAWGGQRSEGCR